MKIKASTITVFAVLFLDGCVRHVSPGSTAPATFSNPQPNVMVRWDRPEFLYTDASDAPNEYPISPDGTLIPPMSRYDIDDMRPIPAQFETYISSLAVSPDHRSVYLQDSTDSTGRLGRYRVGHKGWLTIKQALTGASKTYFPRSMAFVGRERFLYVMYDQYNASRVIPNHYAVMAYRFGVGGKVERLPGPPVVAATYTTAAFVANPLIVVARAITGPSVRFLYVLRPEDHYLDVYQIGPSGTLLTPPAASLALGYRPGRSVFLPSGRILYVADADDASLTTYRIGPNGVPVLLPGTVPGIDPALDPKGHFLYATPHWGRTLFCYAVLPNGTLRLQGKTSTKAICNAPCVDATGRFVYTLGQDPVQLDEHVISQFRITGNGTLMPLQPEEVPAVASTTLIIAQ